MSEYAFYRYMSQLASIEDIEGCAKLGYPETFEEYMDRIGNDRAQPNSYHWTQERLEEAWKIGVWQDAFIHALAKRRRGDEYVGKTWWCKDYEYFDITDPITFPGNPPERIVVDDMIVLRLVSHDDAERIYELSQDAAIRERTGRESNNVDVGSVEKKIAQSIESRGKGTSTTYVIEQASEVIGTAGLWPDGSEGYFGIDFAVATTQNRYEISFKTAVSLIDFIVDKFNPREVLVHVHDGDIDTQEMVSSLGFEGTSEAVEDGNRKYILEFNK